MVCIIVFVQPNCPKCPLAKTIVRRVAEKVNVEVKEIDVSTPDGEIEALMYNVCSTPSIAIGEEVLWRGEVPSEEELEEAVRALLAGSEEVIG